MDGKSRVRLLRIYEKYELADFHKLPAAEQIASDELDDTCFLRNFKTAFQAVWDCTTSSRAGWSQVSDLQVRPYARIDFQQTMTHDRIVSSCARQVL